MPSPKKKSRGLQHGHPPHIIGKLHPEPEELETPRPLTRNRKAWETVDEKNEEYYIMNRGCLELLIKNTYRNHFKSSPDCEGDFQLIRTDKRMISTSWALRCHLCDFSSDATKMYRESDSGLQGRNNSTLNDSVGMALSFSPIGARKFSEIMLALGIDPGSRSCINDHITTACEKLKTLAEKDMAEERAKLKNLPKADLSCDGRYNLRSRNAPCQPATQTVFTMIEHNSGEGKVVDCVTRNKICSKGIALRTRGLEVKCPSKTHKCTASMEPLGCISNEGEYAKEILTRMKEDGVRVGSVTGDGDVKIKKAVRQSLGDDTETFNDPRHLANAMKKAIKNHNFSAEMFKAGKKGSLRQKKGWFADDMRVRLEWEFNHAEKTADRLAFDFFQNEPSTSHSSGQIDPTSSEFREKKIEEMNRLLEPVPQMLIDCLKKQGNCRQCNVCNKNGGVPFKRKYKGNLNMSMTDQSDLLKLMEKRIGKGAIKCTYMKIHTQCNEAFNRVLLKTLPKLTCSPTNFEGRVSAAILLKNRGTGAQPLARSSVSHVVSESVKSKESAVEKERLRKRNSQKTTSYKQKRISNMMRLYDTYNESDISNTDDNGDPHYSKGIDLPN